jgi:hypothetical protein
MDKRIFYRCELKAGKCFFKLCADGGGFFCHDLQFRESGVKRQNPLPSLQGSGCAKKVLSFFEG